MKKLLLTLGLIGCTVASVRAGGTFNPLNGPVRRLALDFNFDGIADRLATAADGIEMRVFHGPAGSSASELVAYPQFAIIGDYDGIFTGLPSILQLPGTQSQDIISLQMRFSDALGLQAATPVIQAKLGPDIGPGAVVWGRNENQFNSINTTSSQGYALVIVPEPSAIALGAIAAAMGLVLLGRRRK